MKKLIDNIFKSLLIVFLIASSFNPIYAEAEKEIPIILDGDFENGGGAWTQRNKGEIAEGISYGDGNKSGVVPNTAISGNFANGFIGQVIKLEPHTDYTVSAYAKVDIEGADAVFTARWWENNNQGEVIKENGVEVGEKVNKTDWTKVEYKFNSGNNKEALIQLVKWSEKEETKKSNAYIDNVIVIKGERKTPEEIQPSETYKEIWRDEFDQKELNMDDWGYELGMIRGTEHQHYVNDKENVFLRDGKLVLRATDRAQEDQYDHPRDPNRRVKYNSGSIRTHGKREFLYGKLEIKAKLPKGKAVFPAFWTLGADFTLDGKIKGEQGHGWPITGEIDIMELIGSEIDGAAGNRTVYQTIHYGPTEDNVGKFSGSGTSHTINEIFNDDFHTFAFDWHEDRMDWYVDDVLVRSVPYANDPMAKDIFSKPQYIQLNLAMGGAWPGHVGDGLAGTEFEIDYVSYSQTAAQAKAAKKYYDEAPFIEGVKEIEINRGSNLNPLENLKTKEGYYIDFSIEDSPMFDHKGGNKNVKLLVSGIDEIEKITELPSGKYNIHYSSLPEGVKLSEDRSAKVARKSTTLTIIDNSLDDDLEYVVKRNTKLKDIKLPENWYWLNPELVVSEDGSFEAYYQSLETNERSMVKIIVEKVDYEILDKKLITASEYALNDSFTQASRDLLEKTINLIKEIRKTEMTQQQVDSSIKFLDYVIGTLEKKPTVTIPEGENSEENTQGDKNPNGSIVGEIIKDSDKPNKDTDEKIELHPDKQNNSDTENVLPSTGVNTFGTMYKVSISLLLLGLGILFKNKQ